MAQFTQSLVDETGKIRTSLIPSISLGEYKGEAANEAAMIAFTAEPGDTCQRTDFTPVRVYLLLASPASTASNWVSVSGYVLSVNGETGTVTLSAADVGADPTGTSATHAALTTAHGSTALNTASAIVQRDGSGNFAAGTITASLTGTASGNDVVGAAASALSSALSALTSHTSDTVDAHLSTAIGYTPTTGSNWVDPDPTTVGGALDTAIARVKALESGSGNAISFNGRTGAVSPTSGDYTASQVTNTPAGSIAATDVQAAINELDTEKQPLDATLTALAGMTTGADDILFFSASDTPAPAKISEKTEATTAASNDWLLMETAAGNLRKVAVGNISGSVGSAPTVTGTGAIPYTVRTADIAMTDTTGAALDCTTDALVATLPASPTASDIAAAMRYAGTTCRSYVKPAALGANILGSPQLISLGTTGEMVTFQWIDSTMGWAMSRPGVVGLTCPLPSGTQFLMLPNATWTQSGGLVSNVKDQSGNGYDAAEATNKPTYLATGINSGPALDFDGAASKLVASTSVLNTTGALWLAITLIADDVTTTQQMISKQDLNGSVENSLLLLVSGGVISFVIVDKTAGASIGKASSAVSTATKYTLVCLYDGGSNASTSVTMYLNNVVQSTNSNTGTFGSVTSAAAAFRIAHRLAAGGSPERWFNGKINFIAAGTGTLTAAQISAFYTFGNSL